MKIIVRNRFQSALTVKSFLMRMPFYVLVLICFSFLGCGIFNNNEIELFKVTPISAVEVALEVSADSGDRITIARDGNEIHSFRMSAKDTMLYDSGLEANTSYIWKATNKSSRRDKNKERQATTLSTTSSEFTWQTFRFGEHSSSTLYGVSIIDENNIWAVGEIYMNDSTGQSEDTPYNVMYWNGVTWQYNRLFSNCRIYFPNCGPITDLLERASAVIAFEKNNVWVSAGTLHHFSGDSWSQQGGILGVGSSNSFWGKDSLNMFFAGNNGFIATYEKGIWQKIESGTELDIEDIHGNEEQGVVAVASELFESLDKAILRIKKDQTVEPLSTEGIPEPISGIWFDETGVAYIVGSGMFRKPRLESPTAWQAFHRPITNNYMDAIDANGLNDIVVSGNSGEVLHFNGAVWTSWQNGLAGTLYDIDIHQNLVVAAGFDGGKAFITMGKREESR